MMKQIFSRTGFWWRTMGFTRCHLIGVFVTEMVLVTLGLASLVGAVLMAATKVERFVELGNLRWRRLGGLGVAVAFFLDEYRSKHISIGTAPIGVPPTPRIRPNADLVFRRTTRHTGMPRAVADLGL